MLLKVIKGETYYSSSGIPFKVVMIAKHGQCCIRDMVCYQNLVPTKDYPALTDWVLDKTMFMKTFNEESNNVQSSC